MYFRQKSSQAGKFFNRKNKAASLLKRFRRVFLFKICGSRKWLRKRFSGDVTKITWEWNQSKHSKQRRKVSYYTFQSLVLSIGLLPHLWRNILAPRWLAARYRSRTKSNWLPLTTQPYRSSLWTTHRYSSLYGGNIYGTVMEVEVFCFSKAFNLKISEVLWAIVMTMSLSETNPSRVCDI